MTNTNPTLTSAYTPKADTIRALAHSLALSFVPHAKNNDTRKYVTIALAVTWGVVTVLRYLGHPPAAVDDAHIYLVLTFIVISVTAHMWGFEYGVLSAEHSGRIGNDSFSDGSEGESEDE